MVSHFYLGEICKIREILGYFHEQVTNLYLRFANYKYLQSVKPVI